MQDTVAFHTGSWIGRALDWRQPFDWGRAEKETMRTWSLATFEGMMQEIARAGFFAIELYQAHAMPLWTTPWFAREIKKALDGAGVRVAAFSGFLGDGSAPHWTEQIFKSCEWLEIPLVVGGFGPGARDQIAKEARARGIKVAFENHPEKSPEELLEKAGVGGNEDWLGVCVDTGWWATVGYDPADAIRALAPHLLHVHLKDVDRRGEHHTCRPGSGLVDIDAVLNALEEVGYSGTISLEHECEEYDPMPEMKALAQRVRDKCPSGL